ncbi:MAG TPA: beta-galactosidase, partial [Armatimonadota bacterium]|nr:beta-galactosidase [Armatimonadota bacterium]
MVSGSDKLLMFGGYEPKQPVERCVLTLGCYPATFAQPRERAVTTALGTRRPGETIELDLSRERWVLYEDTLAGRPAEGSGGLLVGTSDAFESITIPVGDYGIFTRLQLAPAARSFAVALYDFPTLPDYQQTREYFGRSGDREAKMVEQMAAGDLDQPLPAMPMDEQRLAQFLAQGTDKLDRPSELWRPDQTPLPFPWARSLPGGPIKTVLFCRRWCAWETMELARRLEMDVKHLYFDGVATLTDNSAWPYRLTTGIGAIPRGVAERQAATLAGDPDAQLFIYAGLAGQAMPGVARVALVEQIKAGKGLLLVGAPSLLSGWPEELFAAEAPEVADAVLAGFDWNAIPGHRQGERGRVADQPPVKAYRYGDGRVVVLNVNLNSYSALVPRNDVAEGLDGATDRCLVLAARAALAAADVQLPVDADTLAPAPPQGSQLLVRVQDDLDRVLYIDTLALPAAAGQAQMPALPAGRSCFVDRLVLDTGGRCLGLSTRALPAAEGPRITSLQISPSTVTHEPAPPRVDLPEGGQITCTALIEPAPGVEGARIRWEVRDALDRVLARAETSAQGTEATVQLSLSRPVTVCHVLDAALMQGDRELSFTRQRFTMTVPYPYDDFAALMWSYAGGDPLLARTDRMCYEWGADMSDLCHMGGYDDAGAAREYAVSARSGLRLIPYVTRIAGEADADHYRRPCLHDPVRLADLEQKLTTTCRQAAPYGPAAYTLGDENYFFRGDGECCHRPESVAAFREWLQSKYGDIAALNAAWDTDYAGFAEIERPMLLEEAARQTTSYAPWIDHKLFSDFSFVHAHDWCADVVRSQDPGAKVGFDGFLGYTWRSGYDFAGLTRNLALNQTYSLRWLQGELCRSFRRPDALTGKWGNHVADIESGWRAFPWDCLLAGDNSVWWWTSWGVDYIPFNPDLSQNSFGRWFFESLREATSGPGKLLLHATRRHSGIAVLYSQRDLFAAAIAGELVEKSAFAGDSSLLNEHEALLKGLQDLGYQCTHLTDEDIEAGRLSMDELRVLVLPFAACISDDQTRALREWVEAGGTLLVDGRAGMLTGEGRIRDSRPLDELLGIASPAGADAFRLPSSRVTTTIAGEVAGAATNQALDAGAGEFEVIEPGIRATTGRALAEADGSPLVIVNQVGRGRAITLNLAVAPLLGHRLDEVSQPLHEVLDAVVRSAGVVPPSELTLADGSRPRCTRRMLFADGPCRYLGLQQDFLVRDLADQPVHVALPEAAIVYDVRAGKRVGDGPIREWDATMSRGRPLVYALLPYEVTGVSAEAPGTAAPGETIALRTAVRVTG